LQPHYIGFLSLSRTQSCMASALLESIIVRCLGFCSLCFLYSCFCHRCSFNSSEETERIRAPWRSVKSLSDLLPCKNSSDGFRCCKNGGEFKHQNIQRSKNQAHTQPYKSSRRYEQQQNGKTKWRNPRPRESYERTEKKTHQYSKAINSSTTTLENMKD